MRGPVNRDERGGATLELVLVAPVMLAVMMLVVAFGRVTSAQGYIDQAARDSSRVAVAQRSVGDAEEAAANSVDVAIAGAPQSCRDTATPSFEGTFLASDPYDPSGVNYLTTTVTCDVAMSDLTFLPFAGSIRLTSSFSSPMSSMYGIYE